MLKVKKQLIKRLILSKQVYIIRNHLRDLVEKISFLAAGRGGNGKIFACLN
jgi:hypothetical protein